MAINDGLTVSVRELFQLFPDADAARAYIEARIWAAGRCCPFCGEDKRIAPRKNKKGFYHCNACKKDFSVLKGTVFEASKIPLDKWIHGMYLLLTARKGISSMQLSKELSISQPAAWFLLHRLREACGNEMETLSGTVQIDECYVGGKQKNKHKSKRKKGAEGGASMTRILGMREESGRVRAMPLHSGTAQAVGKEILTTVELGSTIYTDEAQCFDPLEYHYRRETVRHHREEYVRADGVTTNAIESVWAVLKRGIHGVYHHTSKKHLARYVNEFAFRLNDGNVKTHVLIRLNALVDQCVGKRLTYEALTA